MKRLLFILLGIALLSSCDDPYKNRKLVQKVLQTNENLVDSLDAIIAINIEENMGLNVSQEVIDSRLSDSLGRPYTLVTRITEDYEARLYSVGYSKYHKNNVYYNEVVGDMEYIENEMCSQKRIATLKKDYLVAEFREMKLQKIKTDSINKVELDYLNKKTCN